MGIRIQSAHIPPNMFRQGALSGFSAVGRGSTGFEAGLSSSKSIVTVAVFDLNGYFFIHDVGQKDLNDN